MEINMAIRDIFVKFDVKRIEVCSFLRRVLLNGIN